MSNAAIVQLDGVLPHSGAAVCVTSHVQTNDLAVPVFGPHTGATPEAFGALFLLVCWGGFSLLHDCYRAGMAASGPSKNFAGHTVRAC